MAKVFIVNKGDHNYDAAKEFGELVIVSEGSIDKYEPAKIAEEFDKILVNSEPGDYILLSGLALVNAIATGLMVDMHGKVNFLLYHQRKRIYIPKTVQFSLLKIDQPINED